MGAIDFLRARDLYALNVRLFLQGRRMPVWSALLVFHITADCFKKITVDVGARRFRLRPRI